LDRKVGASLVFRGISPQAYTLYRKEIAVSYSYLDYITVTFVVAMTVIFLFSFR
tara:strand:- start:123 stop:284 length:162 start_codon:yes stop_codon:yes gene_type:complete